VAQDYLPVTWLAVSKETQSTNASGMRMIGMWRIANPTESDTLSKIRNLSDT